MSSAGISAQSDHPLVSVLVGCYNHAKFVVEALDSIKAQSYPRIELIIWDDASTDDSVDIIERWIAAQYTDAKLIRNDTNVGLCKCLNTAVRAASGKYLGIIAADDAWLPEKIERQVSIFENAGVDVGVVYSDALLMNEDSQQTDKTYQETFYPSLCGKAGHIFDTLFKVNFIPAPSALIRRECLESVGLYDEELVFEDWDMWLRISREHAFAFDSLSTTRYRLLASSMSRVMGDKMAASVLKLHIKYLEKGWLNAEQSRKARWSAFAMTRDCYVRGEAVPRAWLAQLPHRSLGLHGYALRASVALRLPPRLFDAMRPGLAKMEEQIYRVCNKRNHKEKD